jgi:hypothetical protein
MRKRNGSNVFGIVSQTTIPSWRSPPTTPFSPSAFMQIRFPDITGSGNDFLDNASADVCKPKLAALEEEGKLLMVNPQ